MITCRHYKEMRKKFIKIQKYKYSRRERTGIIFLLALCLVAFLLLVSFLLLGLLFEQVMIEAHAIQVDAEIRMMVSKLPFAKIKALTKVFKGREFHSLLKIL